MDSTNAAIDITSTSLENIDSVAREILRSLNESVICLFDGQMGSGKTTLISSLCKELKVQDTVSSPTFSLVNEYHSPSGPIFHFDFYRIKSLEEALDAGVEDYFYSGNLCLIEWPDLIFPILPDNYLHITISVMDNIRNYKLVNHGLN